MMEESHPTKQYFNFGESWGHPYPYAYGGNGFLGGSGGTDLVAILLLFCLFGAGGGGGGFGGWGGNRWGAVTPGGAYAADASALNSAYTAETRAGLNYIGQAVAGQGSKLDAIINNQAINTAAVTNTVSSGLSAVNQNLQNGIFGLNTQILNTKFDTVTAIEKCCCTTQQSIAALNSNLDKATCAIVNAGKDNTQRILDALCCHWQQESQIKIGDLQRQLSEANIISALKN